MEKILIVEDDKDISNLIKKILSSQKYETISAYSGTEAVQIIKKNNIDLILLDLMLPDMTGEEIIETVKDIPIIVISAKISINDKVKALYSGANDYISKPFDENELLARLEVQLRRNNKNKELIYKDMMLDEETHILYIQKRKVNLTKTEYTILKKNNIKIL